jgi:uncharacterized protein (UPF0332 family)
MTSSSEIKLYLDRARVALQQSRDNLDLTHYDVATSRAYYAMFYAATALLLSQGISCSKHSSVHSAFAQYFVKPGLIEPQYSRMLGNAFNVRLDSDYNVETLPDLALAKNVIRDTEQFVDRAVVYLQEEGCL